MSVPIGYVHTARILSPFSSFMSDLLEVTTDAQVRTIRLDRPEKRNALNAALVTELKAALSDAADAEGVRVVVLTGNGSSFSAGADLASLKELRSASPRENERDSRHLAELFRQIYVHPKPIIAQVNGHAIGGGCGLAAVCDFSFVSDDAKLGFSEVRIGFVPAIVMVFVQRKLGEAAARDLLLRGRLVTAAQASEVGLVSRAVSASRLGDEVHDLARELATETSGSAVAMTKRMMAQLPGMGLEEGLDYAVQMNAFARSTEDCQAGIDAFLNDEHPPWKRDEEGAEA
ncbi:methylglutaconyl-CoA hydratase [Salinibacter sp. 10B]|nr:methylglutaconyl-CoA hydratase [Salinibacter sp. 10B]